MEGRVELFLLLAWGASNQCERKVKFFREVLAIIGGYNRNRGQFLHISGKMKKYKNIKIEEFGDFPVLPPTMNIYTSSTILETELLFWTCHTKRSEPIGLL